MCKEEGKGFDFFRKTFFFIIEWLRKGARVIYIYIHVEGAWEGEGVLGRTDFCSQQ
jgi:hypothetical protein